MRKIKNRLLHFAIHIDDIERAKNFYDEVFDWGFNSYGEGDKPSKSVGKTISKIKKK